MAPVPDAEEHSLSESDAISSMSLGRGAETHMLLLNIGRCSSCPEIHLWDLRCVPSQLLLRKPLHIKTSRRRLVVYKWQIVVRRSRQLVKTFRGQNQERFVIRSALGGIDQSFVISGSFSAAAAPSAAIPVAPATSRALPAGVRYPRPGVT